MAHRDRATVLGTGFHFANGMVFSLGYVLIFEPLGRATWWIGALIGAMHAAVMLVVVIPTLAHVHPRMASELHGPSAAKRLEPPGFLALHYGPRTPLMLTVAHLVYGAVLGAFYAPHGA